MTDLEKLDHILMLAYIRGKKNESVKYQKFNEASEWRKKEVEMQPISNEIYKEFTERNNLEKLIDLDDKDLEIQRLHGIVKQLQNEIISAKIKQ